MGSIDYVLPKYPVRFSFETELRYVGDTNGFQPIQKAIRAMTYLNYGLNFALDDITGLL